MREGIVAGLDDAGVNRSGDRGQEASDTLRAEGRNAFRSVQHRAEWYGKPLSILVGYVFQIALINEKEIVGRGI
jgi:hypothetical protein